MEKYLLQKQNNFIFILSLLSKKSKMSVPQGGLIACQQTRPNTVDSYYLKKGEPIPAPVLVSAVDILSADGEASARLIVDGLASGVPGPYTGSLTIEPGASSQGPAPAGLTIRAGADGVSVEVGTNGAGVVNTMFIAGADGLSEVNDGTYNQPVKFLPVTINAVSNPAFARDSANTSEVFRCAQAGVDIANAGSPANVSFTVPKNGFYTLLTEIRLQNGAVPDIVLPEVTPGASEPSIFGSMELNLQFPSGEGVITVPYGTLEWSGASFYNSNCFTANQGFTTTTANTYYLTTAQPYTMNFLTYKPTLAVGNWNIGSAGQIKAELICLTA